MSVKALQDYTYISRYARFLKDKKRRTTWDESVEMMRSMHASQFPDAVEDINWAFDYVFQKKVLGSQRALQFAGVPIIKHNARLYNCTASYVDRLRFFQECMYLLLCGCGTGFSVQKHHVAKLPKLSKNRDSSKKIVYKIPDSIEGWADAIGVLLSSYFENPTFPEYHNCKVVFDPSDIRPEGSPFSHGVGKAPGPDGLMKTLNKIDELLSRVVENGQDTLRPIQAYDIIMFISDAVLSGGVRRSATICLFSHDDEEMLKAKTGNWFENNKQRARSNNSAVLLRNAISKEEFEEVYKHTKEFGEPGFTWVDDLESLFNPCVEIGLYAYDLISGLSGWQMCNLCEINGKEIRTKEDFTNVAKAASIIGSLQAAYTSFPYLGEVTERIVRREALLGVSMTGMMDSPSIIFDPDIQKEMAILVRKENERMAAILCTNPAARSTCVKPAGSTSCLLGTASGIHAHKFRRGFRRVQANKQEVPLNFFKTINAKAVEESVWSEDNMDDVITFCIETSERSKIEKELTAIQMLEYVKLTKNNWVDYGKNEKLCVKPWLSHNVSNTVSVQTHEWDEVKDFIYNNREFFAGISLLSATGDKDYPQAPFCAVYTPAEIVDIYGDGSLFVSGIIEEALERFDGNLWDACDTVLGLKRARRHGSKEKWINSAKRFAKRYFNNDIKKMTYCLKDVYNWKLWVDLKREYIDIDYTLMLEEEDNTKLAENLACVGGACAI
jgi:ribonucleoside-triphosphate reductase